MVIDNKLFGLVEEAGCWHDRPHYEYAFELAGDSLRRFGLLGSGVCLVFASFWQDLGSRTGTA